VKLINIFAILILTLSLKAYSKVDPPNYDFSLDKLKTFMPGEKLEEIKKTYPNGELYSKNGLTETHKYYVEHLRYKFPVFVQYESGIVTDFFARLPSYFLHDVFHQSIINRYGKQSQYKKYEESAVYTWNDISGNKHIYFGSCTITCFPIYYTVISLKNSNKSIMETQLALEKKPI